MIKNIYNIGTINGKFGDECFIGGILGCSVGTIENVYTIGTIKMIANEYGLGYVGSIYGYANEGSKPSNCYNLYDKIYVEGKTDKVVKNDYGTVKEEEEMKSEKFVDLLNEGQDENPWKQDTNNINDGYPILSWQQ